MDRPICLIGTGRCGSSLLLRMLSYHPHLAWMSHWTSRLPGGGRWARLARVHDLPGATPLLAHALPHRWIPQATEHYALLREATQHVFTAPRTLSPRDVTPQARRALHTMVQHHTRAQRKPRFVLKHTGFPRIAYLRSIFPDARFVHVRRDGRAVATSLCHVDWWGGQSSWGWGPLHETDLLSWRDHGCHELVLAALYWRVLMRHFEDAREDAGDQLLEIRYDALVADPAEVLADVLSFCDLPASRRFDQRVAATPITSDDSRWPDRLTAEERQILEEVLTTDLVHHGFVP